MRPVRVLPHIKKLDDCFGDFLVRVTCPCGASRYIEPEALADRGKVGDVRRWQRGCGARSARTGSALDEGSPRAGNVFVSAFGVSK
jgi:hypothetical protein